MHNIGKKGEFHKDIGKETEDEIKISVSMLPSRWRRIEMKDGGKDRGIISDLLVTNSDLSRALWTALPSYRLLRLRFTHDGQQRLQQHIQQTLHHHLYLLLHRALLQTGKEKHCLLDQSHQRDVQSLD